MQMKGNLVRGIFSKLIIILGFSMFLFISYFSFKSVSSVFSSRIVLAVEVIFFLCLAVILSYVVNRFLSTKQFLILLITLGIAIRFCWIVLVNTIPASDFSVMYESAKQAANGDFSFITNGYFSSWVYQLGFTYYEAFVIKLFGDYTIVLKIFNILFSMVTAIIIYLIAKKTFNEFSARTAALLYTFYIPNIIYCSVLTNQFISTLLFFLGIYLVVKGLTGRNWALIGLVIGIGNILRPAGSFFLLAICVYVLIYKIIPLRKRESFSYISKLVGVIVIYILIQQVISMGFIHTGLSEKPLSNQNPYWKFAVGLNYDSNGSWNLADQNFAGKYKLGNDRNQAEISLIKQRLQDKKKLAKLFVNKFVAFWSNPDDSISWALGGIEKPYLKQLLFKYERLMYITICLFALGTIMLFTKRNDFAPILYILLGGYAAIHLLVEIQTRYRFDILPVLFIFSAYGLNRFLHMIQNFVMRKKSWF